MRTRNLLYATAVVTLAAFVLFPDLAHAAGEAGHAAAGHAAEAAGHAAAATGHAAEAAGGEHAEAHPNWVSLGLHAFNLVLLLGLLGFVALPRIKAAMKTRAAEAKREIDDSNRVRKEAREAFEQLEGRLAGFEDQLVQMRKEAEKEAVEEREAILARAERDAQRLQEAAERTIRSETAKARMALRKDAVQLSMKLAEQRIEGHVDSADDQRLSEAFFAAVDDAQRTEVPHG